MQAIGTLALNYYRRYVGDYLRDTSRLSILEHGAYNLLLDYYYAEERPTPIDLDEACRMVRAISGEERKAVAKVLAKFFDKQEDGYHHKRADAEIATARAVIGKQRKSGVDSAAKRWSTDGSTDRSTQRQPIQPPTTNLQPPATTLQENVKNVVGQKAPDDVPPPRKNGHDVRAMKQSAIRILAFLNAKAGKNYEPVEANIDLIVARLKEGGTEDDMRAIIAKKCRDWAGKEDMDTYLRPATLFGKKNFWQKYQGELVAK